MKTKTQCRRCLKGTGRFVVLASAGVSFLLLGVVAALPGPVLGAPRSPVTKLECSSLSSAILSRSVDYCVALPEDYATSTARYPTLYFLHGLFENEHSWSERGGQEVLDGLVSQGQVGKFLVVLPDGGKTFYLNSFDGHERYDDFFIQELVPAIDRTYRSVPDRQARGISGTSMGGYGSLHLSMRHADVFGTASAQSAALLPKFPNPIPSEGRWGFYARILAGPFGSPLNAASWEANNPLTLAEHPEHFANLKLYFDCGDNDRYGFEEGAQLLDKVLTEKGFRHEFVLRPGNHGWSYLSQYMKYALLFHWQWFEQSSAAAARTGVKSGVH
jgi:S-formylglutathione hydrolase FrmB